MEGTAASQAVDSGSSGTSASQVIMGWGPLACLGCLFPVPGVSFWEPQVMGWAPFFSQPSTGVSGRQEPGTDGVSFSAWLLG